MPNFETFTKRMVPLAKKPYVTIQKRGTMSFNAAAHAALGAPEAIELLYDADARIVGVHGVDAGLEHAYPIRAVGGNEKKANSFVVSGTAFTKYYKIDTSVSRRYQTYMEGDVLCIDLNQDATEIVGARAKSKARREAEQVGAPSQD